MELRSFQKRASLIEENIDLLEKKSTLVHKQFESGYVSRLDEENILATLATEYAKLPDTQAQIYRSMYTLSILTGATPETFVEELLPAQPLPKAPEIVAVGLRSDLLRPGPISADQSAISHLRQPTLALPLPHFSQPLRLLEMEVFNR